MQRPDDDDRSRLDTQQLLAASHADSNTAMSSASGSATTPTACVSCGRTDECTWQGKGTNKYCRNQVCKQLGIQCGHITPRTRKRPRSSSETQQGQLVAVEKIYGSRCCDPAELDDVELRNGVHENDQSLQYLVHGKFQKDERDIRGYFAMHYLTVDQIRDALGDEAAVAAVEEYKLALTRRPASPVSDSDVQYAVAWGHPQQYG